MRKASFTAAAAALLLLTAPPAQAQQASGQAQAEHTLTGANGLELTLPNGLTAAALGDRDIEVLAVQVMLDRSRHSPGVIDGFMGGNTQRAIRSYRRAQGLPASGAADAQLLRSLLRTQGGDIFRSYTITQADVDGPFSAVPSGMEAQARMERVRYESAHEMLAEKFHMDMDFLAALNPGADFSRAGEEIVVVSRGGDNLSADIARIEVRKGQDAVVALDVQGGVIVSYPATVGSSQFPSPSGTMEVAAVAPDANYTFDPSGREWGPDETLVIPPGPNNPVGGIWIDLSKEGYGIHGSPDPHLIGKTASHGCVRLTNWDAEELAGAVQQGVPVAFV